MDPGFRLLVVSVDPSHGEWMVILYSIVAAAILLAPRRRAAWVATASTVPVALLTLVMLVNALPTDGFILLASAPGIGPAAAWRRWRRSDKQQPRRRSHQWPAAGGWGESRASRW